MLALVTVGWSRAGADGGGIVVFLTVAFAVLAARMYDVRWTWRRAGAAAIGIVLAVAALVGLDAATRRLEPRHARVSARAGVARRGSLEPAPHLGLERSATALDPGDRLRGFDRRARRSFALLQPRFPAGDALLAGVAVSLLVNDSPGDVASAGALSYAVLLAYERVRSTGAWPLPGR